MKKLMLLCGAALMATPLLSSGESFPLEFKTLDAQQAMSFPGGSGAYGTIYLKAPGVLKEPKAISKHPLYGQLGQPPDAFSFRLDESQGDGKGYDRLIIDLNRNGDLADDAVVERVPEPKPAATRPATLPQMALFGPIPAPDDKKIGESRPIYFAQMYLYLPPSGLNSASANVYAGQLRLKAGWYLETTVKLDGVSRKLGIVDGDCNMRLGDVSMPTFYNSGGVTNWYFQDGDYLLQDISGSGMFESSLSGAESAPFGPILYLGAKPYKAALSADCKSLALDPWNGPLANLALQPHGEQVSDLQLAWESAPDKWQLIQPGIENGKSTVPPGNYRLYTCRLKVNTESGDSLILIGYKRLPKDTTRAEAGESASLKCGSPLEIKVTSQRDTRNIVSDAGESGSTLGRVVRALAGSGQPVQQLIQASVLGAGGETYSGFILQGKGRQNQPPSPTFAILTADGREVGSGNMEFG